MIYKDYLVQEWEQHLNNNVIHVSILVVDVLDILVISN